MLKKAHKYSELIILYEKKGLHQKGNLSINAKHWLSYLHSALIALQWYLDLNVWLKLLIYHMFRESAIQAVACDDVQ